MKDRIIAIRKSGLMTVLAAPPANGLAVHDILRHGQPPEWSLSRNIFELAYEHSLFHQNGGQHKK